MELIPIVLTFLGAYGLFMVLAYILARVFFPTIEVDDIMEEKPRRIRTRHAKRLPSGTLKRQLQ